ncbi:MAG TPA: VOC family protein [Thermoplasmata archaeon]|nr:VOC family protein [Thermoplasmata archaeon]
MSDVIEGLHAVTLHIRDPLKSRAFYRDTLRLKELLFDEKAQRIVFELPNSKTLLTMHVMRPDEGGRDPGTPTGVVLFHSDPAAACAEIVRRGGSLTLQPTQFESSLGTFVRAVFEDPDGNEFILSNRRD